MKTIEQKIINGAALYVGTYLKYNNGSIAGQWIYLENYSNSEEFYSAIAELHSDESDPEFMFQDFKGFPESLYLESGNIDAIYEYLDFVNNSHLDQECINAALELDIPYDEIEEKYYGQYDSDEDFAYEIAESTGAIKDSIEWPCTCIDWERAARDLMYDFNSNNGYYFYAN